MVPSWWIPISTRIRNPVGIQQCSRIAAARLRTPSILLHAWRMRRVKRMQCSCNLGVPLLPILHERAPSALGFFLWNLNAILERFGRLSSIEIILAVHLNFSIAFPIRLTKNWKSMFSDLSSNPHSISKWKWIFLRSTVNPRYGSKYFGSKYFGIWTSDYMEVNISAMTIPPAENPNGKAHQAFISKPCLSLPKHNRSRYSG